SPGGRSPTTQSLLLAGPSRLDSSVPVAIGLPSCPYGRPLLHSRVQGAVGQVWLEVDCIGCAGERHAWVSALPTGLWESLESVTEPAFATPLIVEPRKPHSPYSYVRQTTRRIRIGPNDSGAAPQVIAASTELHYIASS